MLNKEDEENKQQNDIHILETHNDINRKYSGEIAKLKKGFAEIHLDIIEEMLVDKIGLIHNGFIFSSASLSAVTAVNKKYGFIIGSVSNFLTPVREHDTVIFQAKARQQIGRKIIVDVIGRVEEIKIFIGAFTVVIMDKHILNLKLDDLDVSEYVKDEDAI
jgi:acyl-coenzyme A thioesterase PaaI-like protein